MVRNIYTGDVVDSKILLINHYVAVTTRHERIIMKFPLFVEISKYMVYQEKLDNYQIPVNFAKFNPALRCLAWEFPETSLRG